MTNKKMADMKVTIKRNVRIAKGTWEMKLATGEMPDMKAGQFLNIKLDGFYLRRPISICDYTDDEITIIYKTVGAGTTAMSAYESGKILNILIPLGNGYNTERAGERPLLVGGGAGISPMYCLCKTLLMQGKRPTTVLGFNTAEEVFYEEKFRNLGIDLILTTADGRRGAKGFVTDVIADSECTSFFTCGPEGMLQAVDKKMAQGIPGWFSFEERMGCGFGACMGCSCETKYGSKRICRDGPVLERREIIW